MNQATIIQLLEKYNADECTAAEAALLESWYLEQAKKSNVLDLSDIEDAEEIMYNNLQEYIGKKTVYKLWSRIAAAAVILIVVSVGLHFYYKSPATRSVKVDYTKNDIAPGGNKAVLTLANGRKVILSDAVNGVLAEEAGIKITKTADGQLVYHLCENCSGNPSSNAIKYNTIETPKGGQYQVILPDGSKVWLNAASTLKYPSTFAYSAERKIQLSGEAYFEVAKDKAHPFIVHTDKQDVKVLGTHFNVNAYGDETTEKTTLLEGAVQVSLNLPSANTEKDNDVVLEPGEQSILSASGIKVQTADTENAIAWKNGLFVFKNQTLPDIMRQVSRWYNIQIKYDGYTVNDITFSGAIPRSVRISAILRMLSATGHVKFKIEGDVINITN